eukprot:IDg11959t1
MFSVICSAFAFSSITPRLSVICGAFLFPSRDCAACVRMSDADLDCILCVCEFELIWGVTWFLPKLPDLSRCVCEFGTDQSCSVVVPKLLKEFTEMSSSALQLLSDEVDTASENSNSTIDLARPQSDSAHLSATSEDKCTVEDDFRPLSDIGQESFPCSAAALSAETQCLSTKVLRKGASRYKRREAHKKYKAFKKQDKYYCNLCSVPLNSASSRRDQLRVSKHKSKAERQG